MPTNETDIPACECCGTESSDLKEHYGADLCEQCREEKFKCDHCDCWEDTDTSYVVLEAAARRHIHIRVCEECRHEHYSLCYSCDEAVPDEDSTDIDMESYCDRCRDRDFSFCDNHDQWYRDDDGCGNCSDYDDDDDSVYGDSDHDGRLIHSYSYEPEWEYFRLPNEKTPLLVGMELELHVGECGNRNRVLRSVLDEDRFCYKHDSSISKDGEDDDEVGVEMVTAPHSFNHWRKHRAWWAQRFDTLREAGFRSFDAGTCGLHLHLSKCAFTPLHVVRLMSLVYNNGTLFKRISQRRTFAYCSFTKEDATDMKVRLKKGRLVRGEYVYMTEDEKERRVAVNIDPDNPTVELRFFRGTLHTPSIWKAFECAEALYWYTKDHESTDGDAWLQWVFDRAKHYPHLATFLTKWYGGFASPRETPKRPPVFPHRNVGV